MISDESKSEDNTPIKKIVGIKNDAEKAFSRRVEAFLGEIKVSFPHNLLYACEHTSDEVKREEISLPYFRKLLERMKKGGGLFCKPILLGAVLRDTGYPPERLFLDSNNASQTELVLSPGLSQAMKNIVTEAILETKRPSRQLGIKKRLEAAMVVLFAATNIHQKKNYEDVFFLLFLTYSNTHRKLYPHGRKNAMRAIDNLAKAHISSMSPEQNRKMGSVLLLGFLLFEIERIGNTFISAAGKYRKSTSQTKPEIMGFVYSQDVTVSALVKLLNKIDSLFLKITEITTNNIFFSDFKIPNKTLDESVLVLKKLLSLKIEINSPESFTFADYFFACLIGLNPEVKPNYYSEADNELIEQLAKIAEYLQLFLNDITKS